MTTRRDERHLLSQEHDKGELLCTLPHTSSPVYSSASASARLTMCASGVLADDGA